MKIRASKSRLAAALLIAASLLLQAQSATAASPIADVRAMAERGSAKAQRVLGRRYANGTGGAPQDIKQAAFWWQKAADQNDVESQNSLGVMYARGLGVPQDWVQAHMWFNLAAASGDESAMNNMKAAEAKMTPEQIEEARALAKDWLAKHE